VYIRTYIWLIRWCHYFVTTVHDCHDILIYAKLNHLKQPWVLQSCLWIYTYFNLASYCYTNEVDDYTCSYMLYTTKQLPMEKFSLSSWTSYNHENFTSKIFSIWYLGHWNIGWITEVFPTKPIILLTTKVFTLKTFCDILCNWNIWLRKNLAYRLNLPIGKILK